MALSGGGTKCNIGHLITFHAPFHNDVIEAPKRYDVCVLSGFPALRVSGFRLLNIAILRSKTRKGRRGKNKVGGCNLKQDNSISIG